MINVGLALFNLIPGFPLDGGRGFRAIVWAVTGNLRRATQIATGLGRVVAYGFIFWGIWQIFGGNWANGLWIGFIFPVMENGRLLGMVARDNVLAFLRTRTGLGL